MGSLTPTKALSSAWASPQKIVKGSQGTRFRDVRSEEGLLGHRAAWTSQALHLLAWHGQELEEKGLDSDAADLIQRYAHRARALRKGWRAEVEKLMQGGSTFDDDANKMQRVQDLCDAVGKGLLFLTKLVSKWHRKQSGLVLLTTGKGGSLIQEAANLRDDISRLAEKFARDRRNREIKEARRWARAAPPKLAHRATKRAESETRKSASASKHHHGERAPQEAADKGMQEGANMWLAELADGSEDILQAIEQWYEATRDADELDEIALPPLASDR